MKQLALWTVSLGLFVGALWIGWSFRAGNATPIELDLIWIRIPNLELWWVVLVAIGFGLLSGILFVGFPWLRVRLLNRRFRSTIRRLEAELHQLRSLPLAGSDTEIRSSDGGLPASQDMKRG